MFTSMFRRIHFPMLIVALTASTWSSCLATGSFQTKPAFPSVPRAEDSALSSAITWQNASASSLWWLR